MKVAFINCVLKGRRVPRMGLQNLVDFHRGLGHETFQPRNNSDQTYAEANESDLIYMWGGGRDWMRKRSSKWLQQGRTMRFIENGWFPQKSAYYVDRLGTNSDCSLHFDDLSWLEQSDYDRLDELSASYFGGGPITKGGYVLVILQLPDDMSVMRGAPFRACPRVIAAARTMFPGKKLIIRKHPRDHRNYSRFIKDSERSSAPLRELVRNADLVWGLNSTVLSEAALIGKDVICAGRSLINTGQNRRQALAAMVARQVPRETTDFFPWARWGRGMEHLEKLHE